MLVAHAVGCGGGPEGRAELRAPELGPIPPPPEWPDDPPTPAKVDLGRYLFFDPRLSGSAQTSCTSCHTSVTSFQDSLITAVPDSAYPNAQPHLTRNTTSLLNIVYAPIFRWDGSHDDLIEVMVFPFSEPNMNLGQDAAAAQVALKVRLTVEVPGYVPLFEQAFGEDIETLEPPAVWRLAGRALGAFARKMVSRDAAFDRWNAGDDAAMNEAAVRGFELFRGRARCVSCHHGPFFTDFAHHNVSTSPPGLTGERADEGRFVVTGREEDRGAFLTPTLRSVYDTSPYLHDGSRLLLRAAIQHFASDAALADPNHDLLLEPLPALSDGEIDDLAQFLRALRGQPLGEDVVLPPPALP
jgi:cytochrome c peroxidase